MIISDRVGRIAARISVSCPWLKRVGFYGFLFFLIKGVLWLAVPALLYYFGVS